MITNYLPDGILTNTIFDPNDSQPIISQPDQFPPESSPTQSIPTRIKSYPMNSHPKCSSLLQGPFFLARCRIHKGFILARHVIFGRVSTFA